MRFPRAAYWRQRFALVRVEDRLSGGDVPAHLQVDGKKSMTQRVGLPQVQRQRIGRRR